MENKRRCTFCQGKMERKGDWLAKYYEDYHQIALWQCLVCKNVEIEER